METGFPCPAKGFCRHVWPAWCENRCFPFAIQTELVRIETLSGFDQVSPADWQALVDAREPFHTQGFLNALERHGAAAPGLGWTVAHLAVRGQGGNVVGLLPLYVKRNSFGEFIHDWSWAQAWRQAGLAYYPKLFTGLPYTPATGARFWCAAGPHRDEVRRMLRDAVLERVEALGLSSWHVAFPVAYERELLKEAGLLERSDVQFQWFNRGYRDFQEFLDNLSADKRRKLRAERRKVAAAGVDIELRHGHEIDAALWSEVHALYASTFDKFGNHPAISATCFAEIGATLRERMLVFIAWREACPVAVSICFRSDEALYGRYWGARERIDGLHFELCYYAGIDYCIAHKLSRFEPGAGGEHKVARGFEPTEVHTLHWIADPRMREALRQHLERSRHAVAHYRDEAASHLPFRREEQVR